MTRPSLLLATGLITLAVAGALMQFALLGLLGLVLFPGGFLLAASALLSGRASGAASDPALGSVLAAWSGIVLVTVSAFLGGSLAHASAMHRLHPDAAGPSASWSAWLAGAIIALLGAALLSTGLRRYPTFSPDAGSGWFAASVAVFPCSSVLFSIASSSAPFTA